MTNHEQQQFEELDAAIDAIMSHPSPGPSEDLVTSTVEALQAKDVTMASQSGKPQTRRETMFRFAKYGTLGTAASIAIIFASSIVFNGITSQSVFAQVIKNVREATSAKYKLVQKIGSQPAMNCTSAFSGGIIRTEIEGQFIFLVDPQSRNMLQLMPNQKVAYRGKVDGKTLDQPFSIADAMKEMTKDDGTFVKSIQEDGKTLDIYNVSKMPEFMGSGKIREGETFKIWVDRETQLPTQIKVRAKLGPQESPFELDFTEFEWNPTFPKGWFDMTAPEGYQVLDLPAPPGN